MKSKPDTAKPDGFINLPVTNKTRAGLHQLKEALGVKGQAEVVEWLVKVGLAINKTTQDSLIPKEE